MQESTPVWLEIQLVSPTSLLGWPSSQVKDHGFLTMAQLSVREILLNWLPELLKVVLICHFLRLKACFRENCLQRRKRQMLWTPSRPSTPTSSYMPVVSWPWSWPSSSWCCVECRSNPEGSHLMLFLSRSSPSSLFADRYNAPWILGN